MYDKVLKNRNIDEASAIFSGIFGSLLKRHAPLKVVQVRKNYIPWISDETRELQINRDSLKKEAIQENNVEKFLEYKKLRNHVSSRLECDRHEYYKTKFYRENPSTADLWSQANDYLNTSVGSFTNTPNMISHNGRIYTAPKDIANALNDAFLSKVHGLVENVTDTTEICPIERLSNYLDKKGRPPQQFEIKPISKFQLRNLLKKRKSNRSCGIDFIDGYTIKLAAPIIEDVLLHLVNLSLTSNFPGSWKINKVTPRFKKGDRLVGGNWRPVTDIVFVSKLVEAAVYDQLEEYFIRNKLWHSNHHGFRGNHSTTTAVSQIYDLWIKAAEKKQLTASLLLDLSAAFDVVDHDILLKKLNLYNFSQSAQTWFATYLSNRLQVVQVESRLSDAKPIGNHGVPQGSLLGPILFLIFYNDFPDVRSTGSSILYADDDTDNVSDADPQALLHMIQMEANLSKSWVSDNKMICSGGKTKLIVVGTKELRYSKLVQNQLMLEITMDGCVVKESESEKLLGIIVNNTMTWEHHLYGNSDHKGLISKLSYRAYLIYKLSKVMPKNRLKTIAEGIFFSILNYGIEVYGNVWGIPTLDDQTRSSPGFTKEDNRKLQILVNNVLRSLSGSMRDESTATLHLITNQLSVQQRCAFFPFYRCTKHC